MEANQECRPSQKQHYWSYVTERLYGMKKIATRDMKTAPLLKPGAIKLQLSAAGWKKFDSTPYHHKRQPDHHHPRQLLRYCPLGNRDLGRCRAFRRYRPTSRSRIIKRIGISTTYREHIGILGLPNLPRKWNNGMVERWSA